MITCVSGVWSSYLNWFLDVAALPVLDLLALGLEDVLSLVPGHLPVLGHRLLAAFLFWPLLAPGLLHLLKHGLGYVFVSQATDDNIIIRTLTFLK